ncbi:MAG: hypothetical protein JWP37_1145 [Mucilaginibacter sp.]|nr:hypothetical protein [Mucilaginibacter sp.]
MFGQNNNKIKETRLCRVSYLIGLLSVKFKTIVLNKGFIVYNCGIFILP